MLNSYTTAYFCRKSFSMTVVKNNNFKKLGRPTKYRHEYCELIIKLSSENQGEPYRDDCITKFPMNLTQFANHIQVTKKILYDWSLVYPNFLYAVSRAKGAHESWFVSQLQAGLWETTTRNGAQMTSRRFNTKSASLYAYLNFGISERSGDVKRRIELPSGFYDINVSVKKKQEMVSEALIMGNLSAVVYESINRVLDVQFNQAHGEKIMLAAEIVKEAEKNSELIK